MKDTCIVALIFLAMPSPTVGMSTVILGESVRGVSEDRVGDVVMLIPSTVSESCVGECSILVDMHLCNRKNETVSMKGRQWHWEAQLMTSWNTLVLPHMDMSVTEGQVHVQCRTSRCVHNVRFSDATWSGIGCENHFKNNFVHNLKRSSNEVNSWNQKWKEFHTASGISTYLLDPKIHTIRISTVCPSFCLDSINKKFNFSNYGIYLLRTLTFVFALFLTGRVVLEKRA